MKWNCFEAGKGEWLHKLRVLLGLSSCLLEQMWGDCRSSVRTQWLAHRYAEGHHRARPRVCHFQPSALRKHKQKSLVSYGCDTHQLDDSSDKIFRYLFRQITTSPSKENLSPGKDPITASRSDSFMPGVRGSLRLSVMVVLGSVLHAPLVLNNSLTSHQTLQTDPYAYTLWDVLDQRISQDDHLTLLPLDPQQVWSLASAEGGDEPSVLPGVFCLIPVSSNCNSLLCITIEADK